MKKSGISRRERRVREKEQRTEQIHEQRERFRKRQRTKRIVNWGLLAILVVGVAAGIYALVGGNDEGQHDALARCLTDSGVIMYGTDWCPHCQAQKQRFGKSFRFVNYINCDLNAEACQLAGVEGYPTWAFPSGESVSGEQELDTLAALAGCTDG